ncbi:MAG: ABC transporter ATP-binding protein, partial [Candidatus Gastranaerophilaceae bacterium]
MNILSNNETINNYRKIIPFIKPYWKRAVLALGLAIPIGCLDAVIALSLKPYMDIVMVEKTVQSPWYIPLLIIAFTSIQGLLNYASTYTNDWVTMKVTNDLKKALYDKLMHKSSVYYDTKTSGDSLKRFNNDADIACNGLLGSVKMIVSRVFSSISLIGVLIYNSWQLSIIAITMLFLAIIPLSRVKSRIKSVTNKSESENAVIITSYNEAYNGSKIIKAYNLYNIQNNKFVKQLDNLFRLRIKITQRTGSISPLMHVIVSIGIGLAIGYGSHLIQTGTISSGNFVSFITALIMLYTPIKGLGGNVKGMQTSLLALERVMKNLEAKLYIIDKPNALTFENLKNNISFENVSFEYKKGVPVLKNISFTVQKGETMALVGNSGGGKTTIVNLIPRFYKIKQGEIKIDNVNIADYKIESLRNNIAIVLQDNFLFAGTIKENILMGKPNATEEELSFAIKNSCLEEFVSTLENGLETYIGERGVLLSGGQKQRI